MVQMKLLFGPFSLRVAIFSQESALLFLLRRGIRVSRCWLAFTGWHIDNVTRGPLHKAFLTKRKDY